MNDTVKPKFVTCKFTNLHNTKMCGRLNREYVYQYSLRGIAEVQDIIINYTQKYDMDIHGPYFEKEGIKNVIDVEYDLTSSPYHTRVDAIKDLHPEYYTATGWIHRNILIMWGKALFLDMQLEKLDENDSIYFIDAGLSHGGIIPQRYNFKSKDPVNYREEKPEEMKQEPSHRNDLIFNKDFSKRLDKLAGDKIMVIASTSDPHGDDLGFKYDNHLRRWPCAGLFGGTKRALLPFISEFKKLADEVLSHERLVKEETIMAVILNSHPEWFITPIPYYETWYHEDWNVNPTSQIIYNTNLVSFSSFFDMLNNIVID